MNAGKAALLAHHDHKEYQVPAQGLSSSAGKAALLAHRDSVPSTPKVNPTSAASAANALKAASQAHHDPAMRPTKPEDLQAKGAANALRAASQAHREAPAPFKYIHPADDPAIGKLARSNTQAYLGEMGPRVPHPDTFRYADLVYNQGTERQNAIEDPVSASAAAHKSANLSWNAQQAQGTASTTEQSGRSRTNTASTVNKGPVDLMALARRNVDAQMAERGLARTESQQSVATLGRSNTAAANHGANLAFRDGRTRQAEWDRERQVSREEQEISERINREMAQFDQQRKRNENNTQVQSALMEAAKRNARLSLAQMDSNMPYSAPNLRDTQKMEDLLNEKKLNERKSRADGAQVDLGGGHFMSQVEIEAVAARRVQPVFDEMDEQVAEINRRKAEIQAQKEAEQARREAEKAERRKQRELERERERNTKLAEKEAKAEAKAKKAAEREALEKQRREEAEAKRLAERQRKEEFEAAERQRQEEAAEEKKRRAEAESTTDKLTRSGSAEAVATAQTTTITGPAHSIKSQHGEGGAHPLPGTNAPIAGQDLTTTPLLDEPTVVVGTSSSSNHDDNHHPAVSTTLHRSATVDSNEPLAEYQVETRGGMATDTEGETDDEWADAMEETPAAIERAEYLHIGPSTTTTTTTAAIKEEAEEEDNVSETASISTARPTTGQEETTTTEDDTVELAPPIKSAHEHTRFREELA